jgi:type VI protein secretion system component VasK
MATTVEWTFYIIVSVIFAVFVLWMMWTLYRGTKDTSLAAPIVEEALTEDQRAILSQYCHQKKKKSNKKRTT